MGPIGFRIRLELPYPVASGAVCGGIGVSMWSAISAVSSRVVVPFFQSSRSGRVLAQTTRSWHCHTTDRSEAEAKPIVFDPMGECPGGELRPMDRVSDSRGGRLAAGIGHERS